ncbi:MAG: chemotaxis response regulator CheY [Deltaproteobacteria bacterium]|nr:chemotaxis response regulator CheY [Deltaproteobacteria bacterium]
MPDLDIKIIIVDDFATMRRIVKNILKQIGFTNIEEADDGATALPLIKTQNFDLIVSDWNMPQMSGLELLKAVRADDQVKDTPFLMVTAEAQKENIIEAVKAKVSNYIIKPFTADTLSEKINKIFGE